MTEAPILFAYRMAAIASDTYPFPDELRNLRGIIFAFQQTPVIPMLLFPTAAIVPAQCVPWPLSSIGLLFFETKFHPFTSSIYPFLSSSIPLFGISPGFFQMFAARSGWVYSTPVSITAMTIPVDPVVTPHASIALISESDFP